MKRAFIAGIVVCAVVGSLQAATIATFADPALDGTTPLFQVDLSTDLVTGGWADSQTGLNLEVLGNTYNNAWFDMTPLVYTAPTFTGQTGPGVVSFYADGTNANPLLLVSFSNAQISVGNLAGDNIFSANGVTLVADTGSGPTAYVQDASFAFSFANQIVIRPTPTAPPTGFTATAAFTSSAVPEPAVALSVLLGLGFIARRPIHAVAR